MPDNCSKSIFHDDCITSLDANPDLTSQLKGQRIAIIGGFGFVGTWLSHALATLNDDFGANVRFDLYGRRSNLWQRSGTFLADRKEISLNVLDVRTPFQLPRDTTSVIFAAGITNPSVHASEPIRVFETITRGIENSLAAAVPLTDLKRFINISSGHVACSPLNGAACKETDIAATDFTRPFNVYVESRRSAELLVSLYANQFRLPTSTVRAFTFFGPGQPIDTPWAANNFIRDAILGTDIRLLSDGSARRSYLYGSDVATWILKILVSGADGEAYNVGGGSAISLANLAKLVASLASNAPKIRYCHQLSSKPTYKDFLPDLSKTRSALGLTESFDIKKMVARSLQWNKLGH